MRLGRGEQSRRCPAQQGDKLAPSRSDHCVGAGEEYQRMFGCNAVPSEFGVPSLKFAAKSSEFLEDGISGCDPYEGREFAL